MLSKEERKNKKGFLSHDVIGDVCLYIHIRNIEANNKFILSFSLTRMRKQQVYLLYFNLVSVIVISYWYDFTSNQYVFEKAFFLFFLQKKRKIRLRSTWGFVFNMFFFLKLSNFFPREKVTSAENTHGIYTVCIRIINPIPTFIFI